MRSDEMFGGAEWIGAPEGSGYIAIRDRFSARKGEKAIIRILGFGHFVLFINGSRAHNELFLPLCTNYENVERKGVPADEEMATRCYVSEFDISHLLCDGENSVAVLLGGGWYTGSDTFAGATQGAFGEPKVCYRINVGDREYFSSERAKFSPYFVEKSEYNAGEVYDFEKCGMEIVEKDFDDSEWQNACAVRPLQTDYLFSDCPCDRVIREIIPTVSEKGVYDAGVNLTGYPVLISNGGDVEVTVSEEILESGFLDPEHRQYQYLTFKNTKKGQRLFPLFTWLGFRYFTVNGDACVESVHETHADVKVTSSFDSDNEVLNWIYATFVHTMLSNMHEGMPSDCPHLERRGYTGDGQITCPAVFRTLGAKAFYEKWIEDIFDCQDRRTGHVQNTAPYTSSGGGPGGWGIAIVKVPYEFWKYYGDDAPARRGFDGMLAYLEFLESMSDHGLVTRTIPKTAWCLGEWSLPGLVPEVPAAFINTYFYIKAMQMCIEMGEAFGRGGDVAHLYDRIQYRKSVMEAAYFENFPKYGIGSHFVGGVQGADAFALDIGLGNENTVIAFISRYEKIDAPDTGIFGTEAVIRMLFKYGRGDIALKLLTADTPRGFGAWKKAGATTFWEYWSKPSRSLSHPMFGSVVASFFDDILGIKQCDGSYGYEKITVSPANIPGLDRASGSIETPRGVISVSYARNKDGSLDVKVDLPLGVELVE